MTTVWQSCYDCHTNKNTTTKRGTIVAKNINVLEGMQCPSCGHEDDFRIAITMYAEATVSDDGYGFADVKNYETEWDNDSSCKCLHCGFHATVGDFQIAVQEDLRLIRKYDGA